MMMKSIRVHMSDRSYSTKLNDRVLWYDGSSSYTERVLSKHILESGGIPPDSYVLEDTPAVDFFRTAYTNFNIPVKSEVAQFSDKYTIPDEYYSMNIKRYLLDKLREDLERTGWPQERVDRFELEWELCVKYKLVDHLKAVKYILDRMLITGTLWGVGRGSSCASYILYLMGLHMVDPVYYEIDPYEFFRFDC